MADGSISTHEQFCASDAGITIQSSDNVLFKLHRKHLEVGADAFPGAESNTNGEVTHLQEPANVLEVLFGFLYPKIQQSLEGLEFRVVMDVAAVAVEYKVYVAMNMCEKRLRDFIPDHAAEILAHAIKHDYTKLTNESALGCCRSSAADVAEKLWLRYREAWDVATLDQANQYLLTAFSGRGHVGPAQLACSKATYHWILYLNSKDQLSTLEEAIDYRKKNATFPWAGLACKSCLGSRKTSCPYMDSVADVYRAGINSIPPFTDFLNGKYVPEVRKRPGEIVTDDETY